MRDFRSPQPGQRIRSADLRDWLDETKRTGKLTVDGGTLTSGPTGMHLSIPSTGGTYARITEAGSGGKYSWKAVELSADGNSFIDSASQLEGSHDTDAAIDSSLSAGVPVGSIVWLSSPMPGYPVGNDDRVPEYRVFQYGGGGGGEHCPRVSLVGCTAGIMMVGYQLKCEAVNEPVQGPPAGGPVGTIAMWGVATLPNGWLECNGAEFDPLTFPELFDVLGGRYVPDLRNQFVRGKGDKTGALLSKKQWTTGMPRVPFVAAAGGGTVGSQLPLVSGPGAGGYTESSKHTHTITGGDSETAPDHAILLYMIKAKL